jgi:hypothetical protein
LSVRSRSDAGRCDLVTLVGAKGARHSRVSVRSGSDAGRCDRMTLVGAKGARHSRVSVRSLQALIVRSVDCSSVRSVRGAIDRRCDWLNEVRARSGHGIAQPRTPRPARWPDRETQTFCTDERQLRAATSVSPARTAKDGAIAPTAARAIAPTADSAIAPPAMSRVRTDERQPARTVSDSAHRTTVLCTKPFVLTSTKDVVHDRRRDRPTPTDRR